MITPEILSHPHMTHFVGRVFLWHGGAPWRHHQAFPGVHSSRQEDLADCREVPADLGPLPGVNMSLTAGEIWKNDQKILI